MTILFVHNRYRQYGGEDSVFEAEAKLLSERGHRVIRFVEDNRRIESTTRLRLAGDAVWSRSAYRTVRDLIRRERPTLMHVHNTFPLVSPAVYRAAQAEGVCVVQTLHNYRLLCPAATLFRRDQVCHQCLGRSLALPAIVHKCYRNSRGASALVAAVTTTHRMLGTWAHRIDAYIALSQFSRERFVEGGLPASKMHVKPNFVFPDPGQGTHDGGFALFVGRLTKEKGIETLFDAWRELGDIPLRVAGGSEDAEALARLPPSARWMGSLSREDVFRQMKDASVLVFPSRTYENCPVTILEAFATGLPVVASNLGAMSEMVKDGLTGAFFSAGDPADLRRAVRALIDQPTVCRRLGESARAEFETNYSADRNYERLMAVYESGLASRGRAAVPQPVPLARRTARSASERIRVLKVHNFYVQPGGEDVVFRVESDLLRTRGHEVVEYTDSNRRIDARNWLSLSIDTHWSRESYQRVRAVLRSTKPDVVHFHNTFPLVSPSAYYACDAEGVPVVQTLHNPRLLCPSANFHRDGRLCLDCLGKPIAWPGVWHGCYQDSRLRTAAVASMVATHRLIGTWQTRIDAFFSQTAFYRDLFARAGWAVDRMFVMPHFVDGPSTLPDRPRDGGGYALFAGRLVPEKGVPTLLEAWRRLSVPLKVCGDGQLRDFSHTFIAEHRLAGVELVGWLDQRSLADLVRSARLQIVPSEGYHETFGLVIIEAYSQGVPVLAARTGVATELVSDGVTGLLFEPGNPADLASKVEWLWSHPAETAEMGRRAFEHYREKYTPDRCYETLTHVYGHVIAARKER